MNAYRDRIHDSGEFAGQTERYEITPNPENGMFELGDPTVGREKHHQKNAIFVRELLVALHLVKQHRFAIRMTGDLTRQRNLISADQIKGME